MKLLAFQHLASCYFVIGGFSRIFCVQFSLINGLMKELEESLMYGILRDKISSRFNLNGFPVEINLFF